MDRGSGRPGRAAALAPGAGTFVLLVSVYCLLHVSARLLAPGSVEHDEAEQLVLGQSFALGYGAHPPLYPWLVRLALRLLGVNVLALALLKHALLAATYGFVFLAARAVLGDPRLAAPAALSLWLVPQLVWEAHRDLSHSVLAAALAAAATYVLVRLVATPALAWYVVLGLLLGLGTLAKYNFALFGGALLLAAASVGAFRRAVLDARMLVALAVVTLVVAPHLGWVAGQLGYVAGEAGEKLGLSGRWSPRAVVGGLGDLAWAVARFLGPLVLAVAILFPNAVRRPAGPGGVAAPYRHLLERYLLLVLAALALAVVLGLPRFKGRWLVPLLLVAPLAMFLRVGAHRPHPRRVAAFTALLVVAGGLSIAARFGELWLAPRFGLYARVHVPAPEWAAGIRAAGFGRGTIVTGDLLLGGQLRLSFPDSRVLPADLPRLAVPRGVGGRCVVAWRVSDGTAPPAAVARFAARRFGVDLGAGPAPVVVDARLPRDARAYRLAFVLLPVNPGEGPAC
ncbi:MAG: glycosyltransferase family 39 protein [Candidatus Rokubacteria bacterium]|nr:glycosyltransferase family 39 protein [Candidatus Rokubacteria bacterium]